MFHNQLIIGFVSSDRVTVYLKQSEDSKEYAVKVIERDGTKKVWKTTFSLSAALREVAELVAGFTGGFTSWRQL